MSPFSSFAYLLLSSWYCIETVTSILSPTKFAIGSSPPPERAQETFIVAVDANSTSPGKGWPLTVHEVDVPKSSVDAEMAVMNMVSPLFWLTMRSIWPFGVPVDSTLKSLQTSTFPRMHLSGRVLEGLKTPKYENAAITTRIMRNTQP